MAQHRVALVASSYHPHVGGVEEHVRHVAQGLRARGHDVKIWTVDRGEHLGRREVEGIEVRYLPCPLPARSPGAVLRFLLAFPGALVAWTRAWLAFRPEVLHVHCFGPNGLYAVGLACASRSPLVVSSHGETFADDHKVFEHSALARAGLRAAVRRARAVTGCSRFVLNDLKHYGLADGSIVPNGIDLGEASTPARIPAHPSVILGLGRLEYNKGFDILVRAFAEAEVPGRTTLVIGGEGSRADELGALAQQLGVADKVSLPGRLSPDEVARRMAEASVVVVPSRVKAFGIVVLEAWRAGAPVVVTAGGGPADLVTNDVDGVVVCPEDVSGLADALGRLLGDRQHADRIGVAGKRRVRDFSWRRAVAAYEETYDRVVG